MLAYKLKDVDLGTLFGNLMTKNNKKLVQWKKIRNPDQVDEGYTSYAFMPTIVGYNEKGWVDAKKAEKAIPLYLMTYGFWSKIDSKCKHISYFGVFTTKEKAIETRELMIDFWWDKNRHKKFDLIAYKTEKLEEIYKVTICDK